MINFTNLISKVSKISQVSQQNCESRMGTCLALAKHSPSTYLPLDSVSLPSRFRVLAKYAAMVTLLLTLACGEMWGAGTAIADLNFNAPTSLPSNYTYSATNTPDIQTFQSVSCVRNGTGGSEAPSTWSADNTAAPSGGKRWLAFQPAVDCRVTLKVGKENDSRTFYLMDKDHSTHSSPLSSYNPSAKNVWEESWSVSLTGGTWYAITGSGSKCYIASMQFVANPTFSESAGAELAQNEGTVTLTASGTTIYYKWSTSSSAYNADAGSSLVSAADGNGTSPKTVTAPDGTGTYYLYAVAKRGNYYSDVVKRNYTITAASSCTAPSSVAISGTNKYLAGQDISLTAAPSGGTGTPTYQWQKEINSVWTDVTNGTSDGVTVSGATTNNLRITPCNHYHSGQYRCVVSTGATCSTNSDAYGVHVFSIYGHYYGGEYSHNEITWTSGTTGTATIHLNASSTYIFKVWSNDGYYYGNGTNNYIIQPVNWDCGTGNSEMRLLTGPEGDYTFTVNIEHGLDGSPYVNLQVAYPSVSHPSTGYMYITKWWDHCYVHYWEGTNNDLSPWGYDPEINSDRYVNICGTNYWYFPVIDTYNKVIAKDAAGNPSNTTGDQVSTDHGGKYITHDGSWGWHDFATYTISFNNGGGTGTMSSITGLCPDADQALPANTFTKDDYIFTGWHANVATKVGGATIAAGGNIADEATLQDINSNITLTAQWIACSGPSITAFSNSEGHNYNQGDVATTMTVTAAAGNGGTLHYHWCQYNVGQDPRTQSIDAVGGTDANTYTPSTASAHEGQIFYCVVSEEGCSTTVKSAYSGAITVIGVVDPCVIPAPLANEIARFQVPCDVDRSTAYNVTNEPYGSTNTYTTASFGTDGNWYYDETTGLSYGKMTSSSGLTITIKLNTGNFQAGDVVYVYANRDQAGKHGVKVGSTNKVTISVSSTAAGVEASGSYTLLSTDIEADGSLKFYREGSNSYINRIIVTRAPVGPSITATKTSPDYVTTDPGNLQLSISTTGASSGWYYRVKNTGTSGYQTPDNTPYNTATWTMTSGLSLGVNNFVVELYNGSNELQATSGTITVTAETAYPITIAAGAGGSVSPSGEIKANESGNHIHPAITATPSSGYHFVNWTYSNANATVADASSASTTISNAVGACTITANFEADAPVATPMITWNLNVGTSANTTIFSSGDSDDHTNIPVANITVDQTNDGANGAGQSDRTTKILIKTGANGADWSEDPTNYEIFKFKVACGKKLTPSKIHIPVANVGSASANNIKYKAVMSDSFGHTLSGTYIVTTQNGTVEDFDINNADASKYFQGEVTLKLWAWTIASKDNGGSAFRMGTPVTIFGEVGTQATPAATITWTTQPADGMVGDDDFAYAVSCSDGSAVTVTSNNTSVATIVGGKLHYAAAGTTYLVASATDACGNAIVQNSNNFTVSVPATYDVTFSLTNVVYSSGDNQGTDAATEGVAFSTVFAASSGYDLPSTITVTIGGAAATVGTDYTWNSSTGAFEVPAAKVTGDIVVTIVGPEHVTSECITITDFETSNHNKSDNKPDSEGKYFYGYKGTKDAAHAVTITATNGDCIGVNSGAELKVYAGKYVNIYADNTTTGGTPATFSNVTSVSIDAKMINSSYYTTFDIKVGETTIADDVSLVDAKSSYQTFTYDGLAQLSGKIKIINNGSGSSYNFYADNIQICTADMDACTTPTIPDLSNQSLCSGAAAAAWNATVSNAATIEAAGESVAYKWQKKNGSNWDDISGATTATYDVDGSGTVTEAMEGTYRVVVTVSKAGKSSTTANKEVTLSVTEATEVTGITANKATVYPGNSVTLTATANTTVTWQWYTCTNAEGAGEASIGEATSASYTIASAPAAGTYYYKAKGTSSCGTDEMVYTLTVSAAAGGDCETEIWVIKAADLPEGATAATHITTPFTGGSNESASITIDGNTYSITQRTSNATGPATIVVPEDNIGTLYILVKGNGGRSVILEKGGVEQWTATPDDGWQSLSVGNLAAGTYSLRSSNNLGWGLLALKLCSAVACSDPEVTASADNSTICVGGSVTFTAANAHASATYQWQKYSGSAWTNISGATNATYTIDPVAAGDEAKYRVIASHDCNRTSNEVTLNVTAAPVFGDVPVSVSIMETLALSISTVEATDAVKYKWYKSADATWDAGDTEIGSEKNLIKAYDGETAGSTYYIFCRAQNACGITTSSAITVTVTAYVEEDCAIRGNEGEAGFGFDYGSAGQGSYSSTACWTMNSNSKFLTYTAPEGKYFKTAKVTIASSSESRASYNWSTDGGTSYTAVSLTVNSTLTERTIDLSAKGNVNSLQIGRNFNSTGSSGGTLYVSKICFEYTEACTATTVTVSGTGSETYTSGDFTEPTFTVKHGGTAFDPQPTITYTSSNEDIATVDDDGTVTFQGLAGTVKITASYAGGTISATDYCASEGYYTITVSCSAGTPKVVVTAGSTNLSGCNASVTLSASGVTSGGTYQWFRNGTEIDDATSASITVTQAGTYTVEYTKDGCTALSSNSIAVTSEATQPEVERLVPFQYYHVDKTYTDQMKMRHLFAVKNSGKLDGKSFKLYVSRSGGAATDVTSSNALAIWTNADGRVDTVMVDLNKLSGKYSENDELVYTCKAIDCEGNVSEVYKNTITMRVIGATPTLALICSGSDKEGGTRKTGELTVGGDFLTGYNKADLCEQTGNTSFDASTEWGLYTRLKANYIVTPVNGYAIFNKLNYEPFDILLLTDYPKASKSDAAATVLDDMADLCDYRPLLSFKAHMVAKSPSKWAAKGFTTEPVAVKQGDGRTHLNIVCYAHPMFDGIKDAGDHIFLDNSEHSHIVYEMLTGAGYESSKGIQGFEIAAAENFVTIGLIHYNASVAENNPSTGLATWTPASGDRMLVAAAERQANPEARMVMLAVNCGAQSKFTETGRTIVHKCLQYLLSDHTITPMADCSFTFDNGANAPHDAEWYKDPVNCPGCTGELGDHKWSTAANWSPDRLSPPGKNTEVKIAAPVEVDMDHAVARSARIVEGGHISIPAGKALEIVGTIRRLDGSEISPTENSDITIGSSAAGNGSLIFNNDKGDSKARVLMYSTAQADIEHMSAATSTWQYIGTPHNDIGNAQRNYYDSWLYQYDTDTEGWTVIKNGGPLVPFRGYCVTHPNNPNVYDMEGTLVATTSQEIAIPAGKFVVAANSWVAPIDINKFTDDDFEGISDKTIYFFNTGSDTEGNGGTGTAAGTYRASPIKAAAYTGDWQIPSMQGFYIGSTTAGTLHLDYDRHVRQNGGSKVGNPMYAPQRFADDNEPVVAKLYFRGSRYFDRLVVLEREDFTRGYDSGWDGEAWGGNSASPLSCVSGEGRWDAVSAIPEFEGTVVGFQAGEDNAYTIDFEYSEEYAPLYLYDTEAKTYSRVLTGNAYYFTTSDKDYHDRFFFTRNAPSVITGIEPTSDSSVEGRAKKLLIEEKLFILLNGVLYDATGKVVK